MELVRTEQQLYERNRAGNLKRCDNDRLWKFDNRIWIPEESVDIKLKLLVCAHCGMGGHRGIEATESIILEKFYWENLHDDVKAFVGGCLHCMLSRAGSMIHRPLAHAMHASKPNEIIHLDFLYMGYGVEDKKYCRIMKDDLSTYVWLFQCISATSDKAAKEILSWVASFGAPEWLVSDQGSHFKNQLIEKVTSEMVCRYHLTTAYSPLANGNVERVCREVIRTTKALCSEWHLSPKDWPSIIETVPSILNNAP